MSPAPHTIEDRCDVSGVEPGEVRVEHAAVSLVGADSAATPEAALEPLGLDQGMVLKLTEPGSAGHPDG
jgi:hypothetical protein